MNNIKVNDLLYLNMNGADLFNDSESFLTELSDESEQINRIYGGYCVPTSCQEVTNVCMTMTIYFTQMAVGMQA
ncbi:hypothetical protein HCG51_00715 [Tolypothrix sp. PCC 7910]|uniref:hypothetical protein n=1 Tax=Tolypothrix sp. PCC 7910 TaxID=2099387 RepID=UPI00142781D4|nr:hypothetical protein [Tolypothrix sp. PCC 7910]QIR35412.1 hypothetical protein HCG51_00715 [Tolypothrix sp. PCC 7910]